MQRIFITWGPPHMTENSSSIEIARARRILVTGATGLIGHALIRRLLQITTAQIIAVGRSKVKLQQAFPPMSSSNNLILLEHDIAKPLPYSIGHIDILFHGAGTSSGSIIKSNPMSVINANVQGTVNCLDHLVRQKMDRETPGLFVPFSSATVYGVLPDVSRLVTESDTTTAEAVHNPHAAYSESKRMAEVIIHAYEQQFGILSKIARFSFVYGPCPFLPETVLYDFIIKAVHNQELILHAPSFEKRDNIYIEDAIDGLLFMCQHGATGQSYNISSCGDMNNCATIDEISSLLIEIAHRNNQKNVRLVTRPGIKHTPGIMLDNSSLKSLGWKLKTPLEQGLENTFNALLKSLR